jgi:alpha-L-fucosidase 2
MASIYARMGEGERSIDCLDVMAKSVVMTSLMTTHNDWRNMGITLEWNGDAFVQLDADFGIVNALQEMVFCCQKDALSILPSLPARLSCGSVRGLVFPEGTVDVDWSEDGSVTVTVKATRAVDASILLRGREQCRLELAAGESRILRFATR